MQSNSFPKRFVFRVALASVLSFLMSAASLFYLNHRVTELYKDHSVAAINANYRISLMQSEIDALRADTLTLHLSPITIDTLTTEDMQSE